MVAVRGLRALVGLHPSERVSILLLPANDNVAAQIDCNQQSITNLASLSSLRIIKGDKPQKTMAQVISDVEVLLPVEGLIDIEKETQRINKDLGKVAKDLDQTERKLSNSKFLDNAPEDIINKEKQKLEEFSTQKKKLEDVLSKLKDIS